MWSHGDKWNFTSHHLGYLLTLLRTNYDQKKLRTNERKRKHFHGNNKISHKIADEISLSNFTFKLGSNLYSMVQICTLKEFMVLGDAIS
jgi:hypothetical protein